MKKTNKTDQEMRKELVNLKTYLRYLSEIDNKTWYRVINEHNEDIDQEEIEKEVKELRWKLWDNIECVILTLALDEVIDMNVVSFDFLEDSDSFWAKIKLGDENTSEILTYYRWQAKVLGKGRNKKIDLIFKSK